MALLIMVLDPLLARADFGLIIVGFHLIGLYNTAAVSRHVALWPPACHKDWGLPSVIRVRK